MWYRNYVWYLKKSEYDNIKNMSIDELRKHKKIKDEDGYISPRHIPKVPYFIELWKYVDSFEYNFEDVFLNSDTQKYFTNNWEFYLVNKDFIKLIIERSVENTREYYFSKLENIFDREDWRFTVKDFKNLTDKQIESISLCLNLVKDNACEWGLLLNSKWESFWWLPFNLEKWDEVTTSWKYEYSIFELVRLYKTFDFDKNILIYYWV